MAPPIPRGLRLGAWQCLFSQERLADPPFCTQRILNLRPFEPMPLTTTRERCLQFLARHSRPATRPCCLQQPQVPSADLDPSPSAHFCGKISAAKFAFHVKETKGLESAFDDRRVHHLRPTDGPSPGGVMRMTGRLRCLGTAMLFTLLAVLAGCASFFSSCHDCVAATPFLYSTAPNDISSL